MPSEYVKKILILVLIHLLYYSKLYSQTPPYYHFTSTDGLASSSVYRIIQDKNGFIWFATIGGISKFDGTHFTTFRTKDGLNSNSIITIEEGNEGELYIGNYEKGINLLRNNKIEDYASQFEGKDFITTHLMYQQLGKNEHLLYAYTGWGPINVLHGKKGNSHTEFRITTKNNHINKLERLKDGRIIALMTGGLFELKNYSLTKLQITGLPETDYYSLAQCGDGSYMVGAKKKIYKIKNNKVIGTYKVNIGVGGDVVSILCDKNSNLWFSVMHKGFFLIQDGSEKIIDMGKKLGLQNTNVNNFLEDNEGNVWISAFGKGVYCLNNLYLTNFGEKDGLSEINVNSIISEKSGKLMLGTFNGLNVFEDGEFSRVKINSRETRADYIHGIVNIDNEFYVGVTIGGNDVLKTTYKGIKINLFDQPSFCKLSNGHYLVGTRGNIINVGNELKSGINHYYQLHIFGENPSSNRINKIIEDTNKNIWVGTSLGLCKLYAPFDSLGKTRWKKKFFPDDPVLKSRINSIFQLEENRIWISGSKGVAVLNISNDSVTSYTNLLGYDLSGSLGIVIDHKKRIWIGAMTGLYLYDGKSVQHLSSKTGLPSDEVYSLFYDRGKNYLYAGTSNGLSVLDLHLFDNMKIPPLDVKLKSVKAGDSVYTDFGNLVFEPDQNNVLLDFKAVSFSAPGLVKYKYELNNIWGETVNGSLDFKSLKNGKYSLQILAKSLNGEWGKPYSLSFTIKPRFTETIWFGLSIILLIVFIIISVIARRLKFNNRKIRQELEISERINELKHQALSAMMNPHFIFNSLNSVQYFVNSERLEEANDYIAMMAKLIRKNLDTAGSGFILLFEEINRLKLYLDLEKLRFQESFDYEIITGTDVDNSSIMIPNMIIQPFVENSLWHGIINSGNKGLLTVSFSFEDVDIDSLIYRSLIIKVTDNGIGIKEAKKNKKEDHISKGIQIIEERLRLLSAKMQLPKPIMFEDLSSRTENSHGTEVIISLPPPLYKIINTASDHSFVNTD